MSVKIAEKECAAIWVNNAQAWLVYTTRKHSVPKKALACYTISDAPMRAARHHTHLGSQRAHGILPVLVLRPIALAKGHQARREVGEADGAISGVDVLPARALRTHGVHLQVLGRDFYHSGSPCQIPNKRQRQKTKRTVKSASKARHGAQEREREEKRGVAHDKATRLPQPWRTVNAYLFVDESSLVEVIQPRRMIQRVAQPVQQLL